VAADVRRAVTEVEAARRNAPAGPKVYGAIAKGGLHRPLREHVRREARPRFSSPERAPVVGMATETALTAGHDAALDVGERGNADGVLGGHEPCADPPSRDLQQQVLGGVRQARHQHAAAAVASRHDRR